MLKCSDLQQTASAMCYITRENFCGTKNEQGLSFFDKEGINTLGKIAYLCKLERKASGIFLYMPLVLGFPASIQGRFYKLACDVFAAIVP